MLDMRTYRIVCQKCFQSRNPVQYKPAVIASIESSIPSSAPASLVIIEHAGYALMFRVPFNIEYYQDTIIAGHSVMPSAARIAEMDSFISEITAELEDVPPSLLASLAYENLHLMGPRTRSVLEMPQFMNDTAMRANLRVTPKHNHKLAMSAAAMLFPEETEHIKEFPIGKEGTPAAVSRLAHFGIDPGDVTALCDSPKRCELRVMPTSPANTVIVACIELGFLARISTDLRPSVAVVVNAHSWLAGVFLSGARTPAVRIVSGETLDGALTACQWILQTFVAETATCRNSFGAPLYRADERVRMCTARLENPITSIDSTTITMCIMLDSETAMVIGTTSNNILCGMTLSNHSDKCYLVFVKWDEYRWVHLLSIDDSVVVIEGDFLFNAEPVRVVVEPVSSRSICPDGLFTTERAGAVEWSVVGWKGPCTKLYCQCRVH